METVESHFRLEVAALVVAVLALIVSCFYTAMMLRGVEKMTDVGSTKVVESFPEDAYEYLAEQLQSPLPWLFHDHKLFVSRILAYFPIGKIIKPMEMTKMGADLISYGWKRENGFSLEDSTVASTDADSDGFTNFEEYQAETDPRDPLSSPPPILKLRVDKYETVPLKFVLKGYTANADGTYDFQLNINTDKGPFTVFVKSGQPLEFDHVSWKVGEFRLKVDKRMNPTTNMEQEFDESELDLSRGNLGDNKMTLVKGQEIDSSESKAHFVSLAPSEATISPVSKDDVFIFHEKEYLVTAADASGATLKSLQDGKEYRIATMNREERASMVLRDEKGKKK